MSGLFSLSNSLALPFWFLMIFAPTWRATRRLMESPLAILGPALLYLWLVVPRIGAILPVVINPDLPTVAGLLATETGATIAWAHFLAFDLFVGRWIYLDSREKQIPPLLMAPVLFFTLMLGPIGFLLYLALRFLYQRREPVARLWKENPALTLAGVTMGVMLVLCLIGLLVDPRVITGQPAWLKPAKFAVSIALYAFTLLWVLRFIEGQERLKQGISGATALLMLVEIVIIAIQAARGTTSHFNTSSTLDGLLFGIMGAAILPAWLLMIVVAVLLLRQQGLNPGLAAALRWGAGVTALGMAVGWLMTMPGPHQTPGGSHSVGVPDGGPGLPVVGWSMEGGDLRVGHFVGLHALQLLPLWFGLLRLLSRNRLSDVTLAALTHTGGGAYLALTLLLTWQALRGQPLLAPDSLTLAAGGLILLLTGMGIVLILTRERRHHRAAAPSPG